MSFVDNYVAQILALQVALYHSHIRLECGTDTEALHDLRIAVRRIRNLLRPIRSLSEVAVLNEAAAEVGKLTTPTRDREVLVEELESKGLPDLAERRRALLTENYSKILVSPALENLFAQLDAWPSAFRSVEIRGDLKHLQSKIEKALIKQIGALHKAVDDIEFDRHLLRIEVKRTRYINEAFPEISPLSSEAAVSLKALQSALGAWHDHYQWSEKVQAEPDLLPLEEMWKACAASALANAESQLVDLSKLLPTIDYPSPKLKQ